MQTPGLDKEPEIVHGPEVAADSKPIGFWRRQFRDAPTTKQKVFDWSCGVVLPVICVAADPIVFKGLSGTTEGPILGAFKSFAYLLSFISIMSMMAWLIWREKLGGMNAALSGLFAFGSFVSLGVGIVLLPFSIVGLILLIGVLGFTPLFSGFVYLRNSFRAFQQAAPFLEERVLVGLFLLALLFSFTVPFAINVEIARRMDNMIRGDAQSIYANADRLKYFAPLIDFSALGRAYCRSHDNEKRRALADVYARYEGTTDRAIDFRVCGLD
jgi:hypothetical protein